MIKLMMAKFHGAALVSRPCRAGCWLPVPLALLTMKLEQIRAIVNVISNTCAFPTRTVCRGIKKAWSAQSAHTPAKLSAFGSDQMSHSSSLSHILSVYLATVFTGSNKPCQKSKQVVSDCACPLITIFRCDNSHLWRVVQRALTAELKT